MQLSTLRQTLINFVGNPSDSWGEPTDGWGNPTDISTGDVARVPVEQADRNTARLSSGTYTPEQYADFDRQLGQVECSGSGMAYFQGTPDNLPDTIPERTCSQCGRTFRSVKTDDKVNCYRCELDRLCPMLPGRHIRAYWTHDAWHMEAFGDIGLRNELTFWWSNRNSGGNICHQGLEVRHNQEGAISQLTFATAAPNARRCYRVVWDLGAKTTRYYVYDRAYVRVDHYGKLAEVEAFDDIVVDLMVAMMPNWMAYTHRPRNPVNGCFAN